MRYLNSSIFFTVLAILLFIENGNSKTMTRIYSGHTDAKNIYPYVVSIEKLTSLGYIRFCSGVLIEENWVLTAGHCLKKELNFTVTYGDMSKESSTQRVNVLLLVRHPFTLINEVIINDIGLLKVEKIPLKTLAKLSSNNYGDSFQLPVVYAGFGITWSEQTLSKDELKEKVLQLSNSPLLLGDGVLSNCMLVTIVLPRLCVLPKETAPGSPGRVMLGDSGGPLIYQNTVIAVVSGVGYGLYTDSEVKKEANIKTKQYMVFVPVIHYLDWIQDVIKANKNHKVVYTSIAKF